MLRKTFFSTALFFLVFLATVASASASSKLDLSYEVNQNSIYLSWNSDADYFRLYQGKEVVWEGESKQYTIEDLETNKSYKLHLIALDTEGKIVEQSFLSVMTKSEKVEPNKNKLDGKTIDAIVKKDEIQILWDKSLKGKVKIYRNNELLGEVAGHQFVDKNIEPNSYYTYHVVGREKRSDTEIKASKEKLEKEGWKVDSKVLNDISYEEYDLGKIVKTFDTEQPITESASVAAMVYYPAKYNFRYTTFIPVAKADPPDGKSCPTFKGDDRDFSFSSSAYRTRSEVQAYFSGSAAGTTSWVTRDVHPTTQYNCDGTTTTKTQTSYTMSKSNIEATKDFVSWKVTHSVGIPFPIYGISPPNIDYSYTAAVSSDGDIQVTGSHDQAPSHEMYAYIPNSDAMIEIFTHDMISFWHLLPNYADAQINFAIYN